MRAGYRPTERQFQYAMLHTGGVPAAELIDRKSPTFKARRKAAFLADA
jgi:hypothetical protein